MSAPVRAAETSPVRRSTAVNEPSVEIDKTRATHLPEDALRRIYRDNAARLMGL